MRFGQRFMSKAFRIVFTQKETPIRSELGLNGKSQAEFWLLSARWFFTFKAFKITDFFEEKWLPAYVARLIAHRYSDNLNLLYGTIEEYNLKD